MRSSLSGAYGTDVIVGGYFTTIGGKIRDRLAMFDAGGNVSSWNPGADSSVNVIAVSEQPSVAGGDFSRFGSRRTTSGAMGQAGRLQGRRDAVEHLSAIGYRHCGTRRKPLSCSTGSSYRGRREPDSSYAYQWVRNGSAISRHLECACGHLVRLGRISAAV